MARTPNWMQHSTPPKVQRWLETWRRTRRLGDRMLWKDDRVFQCVMLADYCLVSHRIITSMWVTEEPKGDSFAVFHPVENEMPPTKVEKLLMKKARKWLELERQCV